MMIQVLRTSCVPAFVTDERAIGAGEHRPEFKAGDTIGAANEIFHVRHSLAGLEFLNGVAR